MNFSDCRYFLLPQLPPSWAHINLDLLHQDSLNIWRSVEQYRFPRVLYDFSVFVFRKLRGCWNSIASCQSRPDRYECIGICKDLDRLLDHDRAGHLTGQGCGKSIDILQCELWQSTWYIMSLPLSSLPLSMSYIQYCHIIVISM